MKTFAEEFIPMISSREKVWTVFLLCVCLVSMFAEGWVVIVSTGVSAFPGPAQVPSERGKQRFSLAEKEKNPLLQ